ncbi:MAG: ROK family protein [Anaerolineales bacterium]|jgi:glucokinase|nr:ROK family protein [Anaerolineales bacterium]
MGLILAVDIGGTQIRAALFERDSLQPLRVERARTEANKTGVYDRLERLVASIWPAEGGVDAIGIASPGPLDPHAGIIITTPNIKEWRNFPLAEKLKARFGVPVVLDNDANLACLGEWKFGAGQGHQDVLFLTISTGIGGGVVSNGRLVQGYHGLAAELGHTTVWPDGPLCGCGKRGHIEAISSGTAIARYAREQIEAGRPSLLAERPAISARDVSDAAAAGDLLSIETLSRAGRYLGVAVANFLAAFDPSIVIFGGGASNCGPALFDPFHASLRENIFDPTYLKNLTFTRAALGDDAGLLGAQALAAIAVPV